MTLHALETVILKFLTRCLNLPENNLS